MILYADVETKSIKAFLEMSRYRRKRQIEHNQRHNITPKQVTRAVEDSLSFKDQGRSEAAMVMKDAPGGLDVAETVKELEEEMIIASNKLEFEKAALLRDQIRELKKEAGQSMEGDSGRSKTYPKKKRRRRMK